MINGRNNDMSGVNRSTAAAFMPRATMAPAILERTYSQPNIKDKFFLSKSDIGKNTPLSVNRNSIVDSQSQPSNITNNIVCMFCKKNDNMCECIKSDNKQQTLNSEPRSKPQLLRTQSQFFGRDNLYNNRQQIDNTSITRRQSSILNTHYERQNSIVETDRILEAQKLAMEHTRRVSEAHTQPQPQLQSHTQSILTHQQSHTPTHYDNNKYNDRRRDSSYNRDTTNRDNKTSEERKNREENRSYDRRESKVSSERRESKESSDRHRRREESTSNERRDSHRRESLKEEETKRYSIKRESSVTENRRESSVNNKSDGNSHEIKQVYVQKTPAVTKFLEKNAKLKSIGETDSHSPSPSQPHLHSNSNQKTNVLMTNDDENKKTDDLNGFKYASEARAYRYSIAYDDLKNVVSLDNSNVKRISLSKKTIFNDDETPIQAKLKKTLPLSDVWDEVLTYYFATYRGDEKVLENKLRRELEGYDYAIPSKPIKKHKFVRYMKRTMASPVLEKGGFVEKCTDKSVHLYYGDKKWKIEKSQYFMFLYKYDDIIPETNSKDKNKIRVMLENYGK